VNLQLGQRVLAKVKTGVCARGERGVVFKLCWRSRIGQGPLAWSASIIFERGGYDDFGAPAPMLVSPMVVALNEFCTFASSYKFVSVFQLERDFMLGRFIFRAPGLAPQGRPQASGPEKGGP